MFSSCIERLPSVTKQNVTERPHGSSHGSVTYPRISRFLIAEAVYLFSYSAVTVDGNTSFIENSAAIDAILQTFNYVIVVVLGFVLRLGMNIVSNTAAHDVKQKIVP